MRRHSHPRARLAAALALVALLVIAAAPAQATIPIMRQADKTSCLDCHNSPDGGLSSPPNLDPEKRSVWERFLSEDTEAHGGEDESADRQSAAQDGEDENRRGPAAPASSGDRDSGEDLVFDRDRLRDEIGDLPGFDDIRDSGRTDRDRRGSGDGERLPAADRVGDRRSADRDRRGSGDGDLRIEGIDDRRSRRRGTRDGDMRRRSTSSDFGRGDRDSERRDLQFQDRLMDDELVRIQHDIRQLDQDIRAYRELLAASSGDSGLREEIRSLELERSALRRQARDLLGIQNKARNEMERLRYPGERDSNDPDPGITSESFRRSQADGLTDLENGNPLSTEDATRRTVEGILQSRDVTEDIQMERFIASIEDEDLRRRVRAIHDASKDNPGLKERLTELTHKIARVGPDEATADNSAIKPFLEAAEQEMERRNVSPDELEAILLGVGEEKISVKEYHKMVEMLIAQDGRMAGGAQMPAALKEIIQKAKADYAAYQVVQKAYLANPSDKEKEKDLLQAFRRHTDSLKRFLITLDELNRGSTSTEGDRSPTAPRHEPAASEDDAPVLADRDESDRQSTEPEPPAGEVRDDDSGDGAEGGAEDTPTEEQPSNEEQNPEGLSKVVEALDIHNKSVAETLKTISDSMREAWTADRGTFAWLYEDVREKALKELSTVYFAIDSDNQTANAYNIWPHRVGQIYRQASERGFDLDSPESTARDSYVLAQESILGTLLLSHRLKGYRGTEDTWEAMSYTKAMAEMNIDVSDPSAPKWDLQEFRAAVARDADTVHSKLDLFDSEDLKGYQEILRKAAGSEMRNGDVTDADLARRLTDLRRAFTRFRDKMKRGYTATNGIRVLLNNTKIYKLIDLASQYLTEKKYYEAKVLVDELS